MSYAIRLPDQLKQHLRALRKGHGLTQAQLGALIGVKQARMAEIEADPGAVSLDQLTKILAALGGTLHLHADGKVTLSVPRIAVPTPTAHPKATAEVPKRIPARKTSAPPPIRRSQGADTPMVRRRVATAAKSSPRTKVVIRPKKGAW